jgi:outer membrane protein assembly factor BamE (lipoprotein component of BamABCDE complex)
MGDTIRNPGEAMPRIIVLVLLGTFYLSACATVVQDCFHQQDQAAQVAVTAKREIKTGMSAAEVRALLGPPVMTIQYWQQGSPETWKYLVFEDCKTHQGLSAPTTELYFVHGTLERWYVYGQ